MNGLRLRSVLEVPCDCEQDCGYKHFEPEPEAERNNK